MLTILQPLRAAFCSSVSMRGWQVPGFWPMTKMASACAKSSMRTVALPKPIDFGEPGAAGFVAHVGAVGQVVRAELAREQPYMKAASLLARPEV